MKDVMLNKKEVEEITFQELSKMWMFGKGIKVKQSTYEKYQYLLDKYILPHLGAISAKNLNTQLIDQKMEKLYFSGKKEHLSVSLMKNVVYVVKAILRYSARIGKAESIEVTFELPSPSIEEIETLSRVQITQLLNCILEENNNNNLGILISLCTGVRLGDEHVIIRLKLDEPSKYAGLS